MLASISALLLASTLISASPLYQKRSAAVIPLPARSVPATKDKVFNAEHFRNEINRIKLKYSKDFKNVTANAPVKRRAVFAGEPFDIARRASSGSGHDALTDVFEDGVDELYYGDISVGSPAQSTTVDFDTGSSDLWFPLSTCKGCPGPLFNSGKSSTFKSSSQSFQVQYGDASTANGKVATDTVTVAGLTFAKQGFGAVTKESGNFLTSPSAGLLGLGFPANAESGATPWFINLAEGGKLASNVFSFYLARGGTDGSELCIGCANSAKYSGSVKSYPLDPSATGGQQYYWNIASKGFSYNGGASSSSFSAVIDSGTTLIYIPTAAAKKFFSKVPGAKAADNVAEGAYSYPCNAKLGTIAITFGSDSFAIDADDFNIGAVSEGSSTCVAGIFGQDIGDNLAIVGDEFLKSWYSVFDYGSNSVGFAKAK